MSDYLSRVNPVIDPLTYALSNDGQGPLHELHIPRNLLTVLVAGFSNETAASALQTNQVMAQNALRTIASAEVVFMENTGEGRYGTLDELALKNLISKDYLQSYGYTVEITASGGRFEASAIPLEYGKTENCLTSSMKAVSCARATTAAALRQLQTSHPNKSPEF